MRKYILAGLILSGALVATAQTWEPAPSTELNIDSYPAGISAIDLTGQLTINRKCTGFATLEKNGEIVKQIPASNKVAVYTYEDYVKYTNDEPGNLHVAFWNDLKTTPYCYTGTYKVTIPAGFFYLPDGNPNDEMSAEWIIDNAKMVVTPATGSIINELKTLTIEFPDAIKVESGQSISIEYTPTKSVGEDGNDISIPTMRTTANIDGTTAIVNMPDEFNQYVEIYGAGTVTISYGAGAFKVYYEGSDNPSSTWKTSTRYTIASVSDAPDGGYTIDPNPGRVYKFPSFGVCDGLTCDTGTNRQCYFLLYPPAGKQIATVAKANAYLYQVIDGERQKTPIKYFSGAKYNMMKDGAIMFYLAGQPSEPGTILLAPGDYQFVVAKNADYTNRNPELVFNYKVLPNPDVAPISTMVNPAIDSDLDSLDKISIAFPEANEVILKKGSYATINLGNIEYTANAVVNTEGEYPTIEITPYAPFNIGGTYDVSIPASNITVDQINYGVNLTYHVNGRGQLTGVNSVNITELVDVISIDGTVVVRNASFEVVKTLPRGLYIINGHKVIVR